MIHFCKGFHPPTFGRQMMEQLKYTALLGGALLALAGAAAQPCTNFALVCRCFSHLLHGWRHVHVDEQPLLFSLNDLESSPQAVCHHPISSLGAGYMLFLYPSRDTKYEALEGECLASSLASCDWSDWHASCSVGCTLNQCSLLQTESSSICESTDCVLEFCDWSSLDETVSKLPFVTSLLHGSSTLGVRGTRGVVPWPITCRAIKASNSSKIPVFRCAKFLEQRHSDHGDEDHHRF